MSSTRDRDGSPSNEGGADVDFGTLEVFDSNSASAPFSSSHPAEESSQGHSKRDKKHKKKHRGEVDSSLPEEEQSSKKKKKHRKSHRPESRDSDIIDMIPIDAEARAPFLGEEAASSQSKKKRRLSDTDESKKRKKRRSEAVTADDAIQEGEEELAQPAEHDEMDVDNEAAAGALTAGQQEDVQNLARKALFEQANGGAEEADMRPEGAVEDADMRPADASAYDMAQDADQLADPGSAASKRRSNRQKKAAKPTFFEQPPELDKDPYPADELPSPSAATPKPRRKKEATRSKKASGKKLSRSMRGGSEDFDGPGGKNAGYIQGRFTDEELSAMKEAVEGFRADNGLTQTEVNEMIQAPGGTSAGDQHAQLWVRIFANCPNRFRQKIINVARKNFHNFVARGTWTPEQDAEFKQLIDTHGTKWSKIASIVNRHPEDLRDRYRNYIVCGDSQRKDAWNEDEEKMLTEFVIESMKMLDELRMQEEHQDNRELMEKTNDELIDWQAISERMGRTRSRLQCITKWKSLNIRTHGRDKLQSSQPDSQVSFRLEKARRQLIEMPEEERFRLVMAIKNTAAGTETKIPWQRLVDKQFRNSWHRPTQLLLWHRLKRTVPEWERKTVRDCAQHLLDVYNQNGELPEIDQQIFDDAEETKWIAPAPSGRKSETETNGKGPISDEYVAESGDEGEGAAKDTAAAAVAAADSGEMQIDPALLQEAEPAQPAKKKKGSRTKKAKKGVEPSQDPIVDEPGMEALQAAAAAAAAENEDGGSEIDEEQLRKKKTPSKFKKASGQAADGEGGVSESEMDDMEDLPARVAA